MVHLDASLQAVLQLSPSRIVRVQAETGEPCLPYACFLVEAALELIHCSRGIEAHHLRLSV